MQLVCCQFIGSGCCQFIGSGMQWLSCFTFAVSSCMLYVHVLLSHIQLVCCYI